MNLRVKEIQGSRPPLGSPLEKNQASEKSGLKKKKFEAQGRFSAFGQSLTAYSEASPFPFGSSEAAGSFAALMAQKSERPSPEGFGGEEALGGTLRLGGSEAREARLAALSQRGGVYQEPEQEWLRDGPLSLSCRVLSGPLSGLIILAKKEAWGVSLRCVTPNLSLFQSLSRSKARLVKRLSLLRINLDVEHVF